MISKIFPKKMAVSILAITGLYVTAPFTAAQSQGEPVASAASGSKPSLNFEFFKTSVEPIFLKKRPGHARCFLCHTEKGNPSAFHLQKLSPGSTSWTEEQSRRNFEVASQLVVAGNPTSPPLLMHPLPPRGGGGLYRAGGG